MKQILVRKTFTKIFITAYQNQNLKRGILTVKFIQAQNHKIDTQLSNKLWKNNVSKNNQL